jgi:hypothetical protein
MQKPYTVQTIIETTLATTFASLPKYLSEQCHFSIRKYLCSTNMLAPQAQVFGDVKNKMSAEGRGTVEGALAQYQVNTTALYPYTFYLPSYPHQDVCIDYATNCGAFIKASGVAALIPACDKVF